MAVVHIGIVLSRKKTCWGVVIDTLTARKPNDCDKKAQAYKRKRRRICVGLPGWW